MTTLDNRWPGEMRPIWQDEATKLREVKSVAQGHTAYSMSEWSKRETGLLSPHSTITVLGVLSLPHPGTLK
jgi:hypothetical protein